MTYKRNEQAATISQVWDGSELKLTFRRTVPQRLMLQWEELTQIASNISLNNEEDAPVWRFTSNGQYSVQSLYAVLSFRGVMPIHIPAVWQLNVPPRVHIFLWLLYNNKLLTRDNLQKKREMQKISLPYFAARKRALTISSSIAVYLN